MDRLNVLKGEASSSEMKEKERLERFKDVFTVEALDTAPERFAEWKRGFIQADLSRIEAARAKPPEDADPEEIITGFYGVGGMNRWGIRANGQLAISESHSFPEAVELAKSLGITVEKIMA